MNNVEKLISKMCPDGVPMHALGEIGETISGLRGKSKNDFSDGNAPFVSYVDISNNPSLNFEVQRLVKVEVFVLFGGRTMKLNFSQISPNTYSEVENSGMK